MSDQPQRLPAIKGYVPPQLMATTDNAEHIERGYVPAQLPKVPVAPPVTQQPASSTPAPPAKESGK